MVSVVDQADGQRNLHGRDPELKLLRGWLAEQSDSAPRSILVEGEAGIGKTSLLEALAGEARAVGYDVVAARAEEMERTRPFGPLIDAIFDGGTAVGSTAFGILDESTGAVTDAPNLLYRVVDRWVGMIESRVMEGPVLVVVDDLQWADPSTLLTLNSALRRLDFLRFKLALALRPTPRSLELTEFIDGLLRRGTPHVTLHALEEDAVAEMVVDLVGAPPGHSLAAVIAGASGNPVYVSELVKAMNEDSGIQLAEGWAATGDATIPPSLRLTILRRITLLGEDSVEVLRSASLLGSSFTLRDLLAVIDVPSDRGPSLIDQPLRTGLLEERDGKLRFRHDLIREAIYEDMLEEVRAAAHLQAARRLQTSGAPPLQVAEQLMLGAQPGDSAAVDLLQAAAESIALSAPSVAVDLLERSLDLLAGPGRRRVSSLCDLVRVLLLSGQPAAAESRAREALALGPDPAVEAELRLGLVRSLTAQGRFHDLSDEVDRALAVGTYQPDVVSQLQAEAANALVFTGRLDEGRTTAADAVSTGDPVGSEGVVNGLLVLSDIAREQGDYHLALRHAEEASSRSQVLTSARRGWGPEIFVAMAARALDRFDVADDAIQRGRMADELLGRVSYLPVYGYEAASGMFAAGRWDEAVAEAEAALALADEVGLEMLSSWPNAILAQIELHRGDVTGAVSRLAPFEHRPDSDGSSSPLLATIRALVHETRGDTHRAVDVLGEVWTAGVESGISMSRFVGTSLVRLAIAAEEKELAANVADAVEELTAGQTIPSLQAAALYCRGLADDDPQRLIDAVDAYRASPRRFDAALAAEAAAEILARSGREQDSRPYFDAALADLEDIGAYRLVARILGTMRSLGMGRRRRSRHSKVSYGWEALTRAELEVVELAAEGLTNPEIGDRLYISPRTVQTHLSHAFRKLDVSSRVELAAEVVKRGKSVP